ncbi:hypothetical protein PFICI_01235 [Pestalotiopsis fici W106-1]|uniref:NodB homology domain-containing protein n=1 Tax=Pestalotiopsis fici (strain W106-1 / CGMCC3.15140) TaxID=1229662 RepID=W3XPG4_PESFW|nr:uncharacterized protein PFICI_01235 [Pestalotiopsis fici W106-1]ETS87407.1 hypothetical protein PFICI_01235 [Pestalotiopsis fici W106-1]
MRSYHLAGLAAGLFAVKTSAQCTTDLAIDDFSQWANNTNSLGQRTSDDGTMTSISGDQGSVIFTPGNDSYLYENLGCQAAATNGLNALSFYVLGPVGGEINVEIQTSASCSESNYTSYYYTITDLTGSDQTIVIPLASFTGANLDAIRGFVWYGFSSTNTSWELGTVELILPSSTTLDKKDAATTSTASIATTSAASSTGTCSNLLVDDWESQSRLTFLYYNAMLEPSSDDGTMKSIIVSDDNHVTITPNSSDSYFFTVASCVNAKNVYGGISLPITAPQGTTLGVQLGSPDSCGNDTDSASIYVESTDLGWAFDGTEQLYSIPFAKFQGLDTTKVQTILFAGLSNAVTFGPMAFYCGDTPSRYVLPATTTPVSPTATVPAPAGTASALVIDNFSTEDANTMGFWHGADEGMSLTWSGKSLTIKSDDADYAFYSQVSESCSDLTSYSGSYLHIAYSGSNKFSVALQQHNAQCNEEIAPYPETWDSLEAARYASASDIYIPMSHFNGNQSRAIGIALLGFYSTDSTVLSKMEIVPSIPADFTIPSKLPSGNYVFACTRPNSFAFAIDDGDPKLAQQVMQIVKEEDIKVTFFTVGAPLDDSSTNLTNVYREMMAAGHQIALHSFTHPKMEGLPSYEAIDWEYNNDFAAVAEAFDGLHTPYFRPPFGTEGARMRQRLAVALDTETPYIVGWSVDVEDWLWAESNTPEKQLDAFKRDLAKGGNLVVMHYLYSSTVGYLQEFIQLAKATGKQLMRVDQCMEDPNAPPL